jgi:hypothetical protein
MNWWFLMSMQIIILITAEEKTEVELKEMADSHRELVEKELENPEK